MAPKFGGAGYCVMMGTVDSQDLMRSNFFWNAVSAWSHDVATMYPFAAPAGFLGVLGIELRNPTELHRQKAFLVPGIVPKALLPKLEQVPTWDEWDPDAERWVYDTDQYLDDWRTP